MIEKQIGAVQPRRDHHRADPGRGRLHRPGRRLPPGAAEWANANGVVFIADEVQTGFARTGTMFASEQFGIVPDLIVTAKGIAGGLPLSAVTGRAEIMDAPQVGGLGGTYGGNPLACVAALAAIETYETEDLAARARADRRHPVREARRPPRRRPAHRRGPRTRRHGRDRAGRPRDRASRMLRSPSKVAAAAHAAGVVLLTCGTYGNVIRFLPPLSIPDHLLIEGLDVVAEALANA